MKRILIVGAGMSSIYLIKYLEEQTQKYGWELTVADMNVNVVKEKTYPDTQVTELNVLNDSQRDSIIQKYDIVISMLPANLHIHVARTCLKYSKYLLTASYESDEIKKMRNEIKENNLLFLNEMGLDPGLDHMSTMQILDRIRSEGHELLGFESFTGGLIAPESDNNPWHYKFSWNPSNVVRAGREGPAKFIQEGKYKYIPYNRLFRRTEIIEIDEYGKFEGYANRDSLVYIEKYNLQGVPTVYRGTLRRPGFCKAWDVFVQLGVTDDSYILENSENLTHKEFINSFLYYSESDPVELKLYRYMHIDQDSSIIEKLRWLGIFEDTPVGIKNASPAKILEHILNKKWRLEPEDKDMIVMWHKITYKEKDNLNPAILTSSLCVTGENLKKTAMAKTVGLPLAIATKLVLTGKINVKGLYIPTIKEIYEPVLNELKDHGIAFIEKGTKGTAPQTG
jgi:saccharopine dehydrogenase-like NADP-dependent oxidoreductase